LLFCYAAKSLTGTIVRVTLEISSVSSPSTVQLVVTRDSPANQYITWVRYTLIIIHKTAMNSKKYIWQTGTEQLYTNPGGPNRLLADISNLGINTLFQNSQLGGYQEYCLIGITDIRQAGVSASLAVREMLFDSRLDPIAIVGSFIPYSNGIDYEVFQQAYRILCVKQCDPGFYYAGQLSCNLCRPECT
jgi:hypothetical protein